MRTTAQDERCTKLLSGEQRARVVVHDDLLTARQAHLDSRSCNEADGGCKPASHSDGKLRAQFWSYPILVIFIV